MSFHNLAGSMHNGYNEACLWLAHNFVLHGGLSQYVCILNGYHGRAMFNMQGPKGKFHIGQVTFLHRL